MKFNSSLDDPVNGSNMYEEIFGRAGVTRHEEFKTFLLECVIPLIPTPPSTSHPDCKLYPPLKHMMRVAKNGINISRSISVDEMYISFQVRHKDKQILTYKNVVDDFLVDALCAEGYKYSWYFRNQLVPEKVDRLCTIASACSR